MELRLTAGEERLFSTLRAAVDHCKLGTQIRVAGGWVRDKLLGVQSHDIDIALDNMTGKKFCEEVLPYLRSINALTGKLDSIPKNPERSEHLETSFLQIYGQRIELAHLRTEEYSENSRVPKVKNGTPVEDAYRRDFTANSLFYNLSTGRVEDFTGKGISDLKAGMIRTPLPPLKMFLDDPLRVLRAVRFASRFGFELDPELKQAASAPEVYGGLSNKHKLSEQLVIEEAKTMIFGKDPLRAMQLLRELGCIDLVFRMPAGLVLPDGWESLGAEYMIAGSELMQVLEENVKCVTALASFLLPLRDYAYSHCGKTLPVSAHVIRECLRYNEAVSTEVASLLAAVGTPHIDSWFQRSKSELVKGNAVYFEGDARVEAGLLLNELLLLKGARASFKENSVEAFVALMTAYNCRNEERVTVCKALKAAIVNSGLYKVKCVLNGKDVIKVLGVANGNSQVGSWLRRALVWQLQNTGASASDCEKWMRASRHDSDEHGPDRRSSKRRAIYVQT